MRKIILLFACIWCVHTAQAQLVLTVAGVLDSVGAINGPTSLATFNNPHGIAVDPAGNIYVADRFGHKIRKITPGGTVSTLAGSGQVGAADGVGINATFHEPWGLCVDSTGVVYVADTRNNLIRKIDQSGTVTTVAGSGNFGTSDGQGTAATFGNPTGIEIAADGSLYIADHLTHIIRRISPNGFVSTLAGSAYITGNQNGVGNTARFNRPYGLTIDPNGDILVADEWNHLIRKITPAGVVTTIAGTGIVGSQDGPAGGATFNYPWDVTVDSSGNIFIADGYNDVIRKLDVSGNVSTYVGTAGNSGATDAIGAAATFNGATGIAYLGSTDEIYVADAYNNLIRKIVNLNQQTVALQVTSTGGTDICEGDTFSVKAAPEIFQTYDFYVDNILQQSSTSPNFATATLAPGNRALMVIAYDNGNAIQSIPIQVNVQAVPDPFLTAVGPTTFYEGDSVTLVSTSGTSYLWSNGDTNATLVVKTSGTYWIDVTNSVGCTGRSDSIVVDVIQFSELPTISIIEGNETLCHGETATLESSYDNNNQWYVDGFPISGATNKTYVASATGTYQVEATDSLGFTLLSDPVNIVVKGKQIVDFSASEITVDPNTEVQFSPTVNENDLDFFWNFGDATSSQNTSNEEFPRHIYENTGTYTVTLITSDLVGCSDTLTKQAYITVGDADNPGGGTGTGTTGGVPGGDTDIFIPTAFTPNGDGKNDIFLVRGVIIANLTMQIYNQWGEMIFESFDQSQGWNGRHGSIAAQNGTYVYVIQVDTINGETRNFKGHITLIR